MAYYAPTVHSAPWILDKYPHMLMVLGFMENRFDGIKHIDMMLKYMMH